MKIPTVKLSARFLISLIGLGFLTTAFSFYAMSGYRSHYYSILRKTEDFSRRLVSAHQDLLNQKFATRIRTLKRLTELGFTPEVVASEKLETSDWLWIKAPNFSWQASRLAGDPRVSGPGSTQIGKNEFHAILDSERKRLIFQFPYSDGATAKNSDPRFVEAALDLTATLDPESSAAYRVGIYFVGPDGSIYPIGGDRGLLDWRPGMKSPRKLAQLDSVTSDLWHKTTRVSRLPLRADTTLLGAVHVEGLNGQLLVATRSRADAGYGLIVLTLAFLTSLCFLFFNERIWKLLPERFEGFLRKNPTGPMKLSFERGSLKFVPATESPETDRLRENFLEKALIDDESGMKAWDLPEQTLTSELAIQVSGTGSGSMKPPTSLPRLYLKKKAEERKHKIFEIELTLEERQSFLRRMSVEVAEIQDLAGLATFFSKTFTRLLDGAPAAFFAVDPKDGRVQLLSRSPDDLFSRVIPAAFLPLDSDDSFDRSAGRYLKDVAMLSSDLIAPGTDWSVFALGAGHRRAGFWAFPIQVGNETRFFVRMICEIFLGHYLFLKSEEIEKRKTFYQSDLLMDRLQEESLQNTRLRHPFSLALIETKLSQSSRTELDSMIFGAKSDETLKVGKYLRDKVRRSDRVFLINENQIVIFFPHTAVLDLLAKTERIVAQWNSTAPNTHGLRAIMIEFPTHCDSVPSIEAVMKKSFETLKKAQAGQVLMATAPIGYLPPFKSRFIRSAIIPESPK